ncbi:alpha/beta hydrolase family protein [Pyxidicoccus xibeiensis]|uniref:alpha/beta hydrolase family protein n=1 Tax=Pyxidicoccus xibeiensis TaxID=2906759 RepID=UPI0020A7F5EA|nr:prolyl oligopeptidase family serine peptidase [Pyxidicoccus xibeiensis]MCP3141377.1 prolyl oligopeptidase family serine peptidase [Pyxidicoccus xibeiensis]
MRTLLLTLCLGLSLTSSPSLGGDEAPPPSLLDPVSTLSVTLLGTGQAEAGGQVWHYQLLRLQEPGKVPTYAQWFPPRNPGLWPTLMLARPYDGISWSGEAVDAKWAARGPGIHPDDSEPHHHAGSSPIAYSLTTPEQLASEAFIYLLHDFGVLAVYGRFYAGGNLQNDRDDMHAGMRFLAQAPGVDRSRIGVFGGSWGGFEALYAAADAPAASRPKVGVALYPLSDFARQLDYLSNVVPSRVTDPAVRARYASFFEPYSRRIFATTGGPPGAPGTDYSRWTREHLAPRLDMPFLVIHEDWDTLVPVEQTRTLAAQAGPRLSPLYFEHLAAPDWNTAALSHGPLMEQYVLTVGTLSVGHLLTNLGSPAQLLFVPYVESSLVSWLWEVRVLQWYGRDVSAVAPRLRELADARVVFYELNTGGAVFGADWVAAAVNALWGTQYTSANIREALAGGLPH